MTARESIAQEALRMTLNRLLIVVLAVGALVTAAPAGGVLINEIRIDQPGGDDDEYFELSGTPGASLDGLTYIVIGDSGSNGGVIEAAIDLSGNALDGDGRFLVADTTFTLGTPDLTAGLNFENSDNVTHLVVSGFFGAESLDLDAADDGVLDAEPWSAVLDSVALVEALGTDPVYSSTIVGPDGSFVPAHVYRCETLGTWTIGPFDPVGGDDTPGDANTDCTVRLDLVTAACQTTETIIVEVNMSQAEDLIIGGQFTLEYENTQLDFISIDPGDAPFEVQFFESVNEGAGTIEYAVTIMAPPGTMADTTLARVTFESLGDSCEHLAGRVRFNTSPPNIPNQLTNLAGDPIIPVLDGLDPVRLDSTPPVLACPPDVTIECIEDADPGLPYATAEGGVAIYYNDNGGGENPFNQAYLKAQFSGSNTNGAELNFSTVPLTGNGLITWNGIYQAAPDQFGLDFVMTTPSSDGSVPTPELLAYDNTDNSLAGAAPAGAVEWAINGYAGVSSGPANPANGIINSLIRGLAPGNNSVIVTRNDLSLSGTVFTAVIEGILQSTGTHYWYTLGVPDSPMSNFFLNGQFFFSATLTYDAAGDPGTDLIDFYEGTITINANFPSTLTGFATATDNCTLFPEVSYTDTDNGGSGCLGDPLIITRTWMAVDECGSASTCQQIITVEDDVAPTFLFVPPDQTAVAEIGGCTGTLTAEQIGVALATDNCDTPPVVTFSRSDGAPNIDDPFHVDDSPIIITWTATDVCGNAFDTQQQIFVDALDELEVTVELANVWSLVGGPLTVDRCITFELHDCDGNVEEVSAVMTFFSSGVGDAANATGSVEIPCGEYDCITARDKLHTLRRTDTDDFMQMGNKYVADFTASPGNPNDSLLGGNFNDDQWVDILDFGIYVGLFGDDAGTGDQDCDTPAPDADASGDGEVSIADLTFISIFFTLSEENACCLNGAVATGGPRRADTRGPITRISVDSLRRRGLGDLTVADLDGNGWLEPADVAAFAGGARP